jgi:hypothetical protein
MLWFQWFNARNAPIHYALSSAAICGYWSVASQVIKTSRVVLHVPYNQLNMNSRKCNYDSFHAVLQIRLLRPEIYPEAMYEASIINHIKWCEPT